MTASPEDRQHQRILELLPWWVNGTLEEVEARRVEEHLEGCGECRQEERRCRRLADLVSGAEDVAPVPHPTHLERLLVTIEQEAASGRRKRGSRERRLPGWLRATPSVARWLLAAQAAALFALALGLTVLLWQGPAGRETAATEAPTPFRTLAAPDAASATGSRVRVVFATEASEREIRGLLLEMGAELVAGPSRLGVYTVEIPGGAGADPLEIVLDHLRRMPLIRFVEPVAGGEVGAGGDD